MGRRVSKKTRSGRSFRNRIHLVLALLGIIPYLLTIYIFMESGLTITQSIMLIAAVALLFHLAGFQILRRFSDSLVELVRVTRIGEVDTRARQLLESDHSTIELADITRNFNMLLNELEESKRQFNDITIALMKRAREDVRNYQKKLQESQLRHESLKPYLSTTVIEQVAQLGSSKALHNEKRMATLLFADIRSFTMISERMEPEDVVELLNEYFDTMVAIIHRHHGVLDKFVGDQVMAVFGLTTPLERTTVDAVNAALEMRRATDRMMEERRRAGRPTFKTGFGLNTGDVIAGSIGSVDRKDYTVIGDTVNVAARLEHLARGGEILVGEETYRRCRNDFDFRVKGTLKVRNRDTAVKCYEVLGRAGSSAP